MVKIKSIHDLERIKNQTLEKELKSNQKKVVVGMGTCGISAGAGEVMEAIQDEIKKRNLTDVVVTPTGCIGLCVQEPLVEVTVPGKEKVAFCLVDAAKGRQIVEQYLVNGIVNEDWVVNY
ncbi:(2Fe-2S) ferredoxin domain-containing protein [Candidatus Formimonas warabiya]|uniref:Ferredoxin n=1 Tax=Formimonas warabiya TaxID=1761012 RepID=A0A3G1KQC2_FORW1|nr:(2Fe-2S) ferredoxin domain-containing protein [Candidatus Formimonas warabiya]ATW24669.1 ferredoxin [Candidatus Formimonas warabiya]